MLDIKVGDIVMYMDRKATVRRTHALGKDSRCELVFEDTGKHMLIECKEMMKCACKENGDKIRMMDDNMHGSSMTM